MAIAEAEIPLQRVWRNVLSSFRDTDSFDMLKDEL